MVTENGATGLQTAGESQDLLDLPANADLATTLGHCREILEDTEMPTVKRWRERGGKVLGHFQVYFPEELAHAAGMLPACSWDVPGMRLGRSWDAGRTRRV